MLIWKASRVTYGIAQRQLDAPHGQGVHHLRVIVNSTRYVHVSTRWDFPVLSKAWL